MGMKYRGLSSEEAERRLKKYGKNILVEEKEKSVWDIIEDQFRNAILWLLLLAAVISMSIGEYLEAIGIFVAIVISVGFGAYLEYKADRSMRKLKKLLGKKVLVIRDGKPKLIPAEEVVVGDLVVLESGAFIPADGEVIEAKNFYVDESTLTGESLPTKKMPGKVKAKALAERFNYLFAGTYVVRGEGKMIVKATGKETVFGKLSRKLEELEETKTPLMKNLDEIAKGISFISLSLIVVLFVIGYLQGRKLIDLFIYSVTLAVAAVPEGLAAVITILLTLSIMEMVKKHALVKKLSSVEALGNMDVIALDKTGTITEGRLKLAFVYVYNKIDRLSDCKCRKLLETAALATSVRKAKGGYVGDDIDVAIAEALSYIGKEIEKVKKNIVKFEPFTPERKYAKAILRGREIIKGAPEILLAKATHVEGERLIPINKAEKEVKKAMNYLTGKGYRVIAVLEKRGKKIIFRGFLAFSDVEKREARHVIERLKEAGIKPIMLTGDNLKTAISIAKRVGIASRDGEGIEWYKIEDIGREELYALLRVKSVIARSTPESKLRVVEVLIDHNHIVGVTGDGINDALALKKAHVGIVMGKKGSDVSKEVADLILLDDNISTILKAIAQGRTVIRNIINFIKFQFTANASALLLSVYAFVANLRLPLSPLQLLWINLVMDGPPALSLGFEPPSKEVLSEKPRRGKPLLSMPLIGSITISALYISIMVFLLFLREPTYEKALAVSFNAFVFFQLFNTLNCRSHKQPFYKGLSKNPLMIITLITMAVIQISINYIPPLAELFNTQPLSSEDWATVFILSSTILLVEEIKKSMKAFYDISY